VRAKLSSSSRTQLSQLLHRAKLATLKAVSAGLLGDDRAQVEKVTRAESAAWDAVFAALYVDVDVTPARRRGRRA